MTARIWPVSGHDPIVGRTADCKPAKHVMDDDSLAFPMDDGEPPLLVTEDNESGVGGTVIKPLTELESGKGVEEDKDRAGLWAPQSIATLSTNLEPEEDSSTSEVTTGNAPPILPTTTAGEEMTAPHTNLFCLLANEAVPASGPIAELSSPDATASIGNESGTVEPTDANVNFATIGTTASALVSAETRPPIPHLASAPLPAENRQVIDPTSPSHDAGSDKPTTGITNRLKALFSGTYGHEQTISAVRSS